MAINQRKIIQASYGVTEVENANINRSPSSYEKNDPEYLNRYARIGFYTNEHSSHSRSKLLNWAIVCDSAILNPMKVMVILTRILPCFFLRMIMVPSVNSTGSLFIQQQWIIQIHWLMEIQKAGHQICLKTNLKDRYPRSFRIDWPIGYGELDRPWISD